MAAHRLALSSSEESGSVICDPLRSLRMQVRQWSSGASTASAHESAGHSTGDRQLVEDSTRSGTIAGVLIVVLLVSPITAQVVSVGGQVTLADGLIIVGVLGALVAGTRQRSQLHWHGGGAVFAVGSYFWVLASVVGLAGVGFTGWAVEALAVDLFLVAGFLALRRTVVCSALLTRIAMGLIVAQSLAVALLLISEGGVRASGPYINPNVPAHILALVAVLASTAPTGRLTSRLRYVVVIVAVLAILRTGSMTALLMLAAVVVYLAISARVMRKLFGMAAVPLATAAVIVAVLVSVNPVREALTVEDLSSVSALTDERLDRSSTTRLDIWSDSFAALRTNPLGVGPYGIPSRGIADGLEAHSDLVAIVVERGPLGATALLLIASGWWSRGVPAGPMRCCLVALLVGGVFRETLHFRHVWIVLALAVAYEALWFRPRRAHA